MKAVLFQRLSATKGHRVHTEEEEAEGEEDEKEAVEKVCEEGEVGGARRGVGEEDSSKMLLQSFSSPYQSR